jgi:flagellar basal body rod protein FlgB
MRDFVKNAYKDLHPPTLAFRLKSKGKSTFDLNNHQAEFMQRNFANININNFKPKAVSEASPLKYVATLIDNKRIVLISNVGHMIQFTDEYCVNRGDYSNL